MTVRLEDTLLPKHVLYDELAQGKRLQCKRFKDNLKDTIKKVNVDTSTWEHFASSGENVNCVEAFETTKLLTLS